MSPTSFGSNKERYGIGFELGLTLDWNGRFVFQAAPDSTESCNQNSAI